MSTFEEQEGLTFDQAFTETETTHPITQSPQPTETPTSTPEPTEPTNQPIDTTEPQITDADKWRKRLAELNFKTPKEARKWARENCTDGEGKGERIGALGTAYRIINRMKFGNRLTQESRECTFKIKKEDVDTDTFIPDDPPPNFPENPTAPIQTYTTNTSTPITPQPTQPLKPTQLSEKMLSKAAKSGWNVLCDFSGAPEAYLNNDEAQELAEYLHPVIQTRFPQIANNPEVVAIIGAGSILAPKAKPLMDARKRRAKETELPPTPIIQPTPAPIPQPEPTQITPQPTQQEQPHPEVTELKNNKPAFYKQLK